MSSLWCRLILLGFFLVQPILAWTDSEEERSSNSTILINGRLTLTAATPVTTSDVTAATIVYFTPYGGNKIALYSGATWQLLTFSETSVAVPSNASTPFDIFAYNNSGTLALETTAWTNDSTRATALTLQDGVYSKSGATTRRYLGTGRTTAVSGQTEDSLANRFLWNYYNRTPRLLSALDNTTSWSYSLALDSPRAARAQTTNRVSFVVGVAEIPVHVTLYNQFLTSAGCARAGIGIDSTSTQSGPFVQTQATTAVTQTVGTNNVFAAGYHYYQWLEWNSCGLGAVTQYGYGVFGLAGQLLG